MLTGTEKMRQWREKNRKICPKCQNTEILKESKTCRPCSRYKLLPDRPLSELIYTEHHKSSAFAIIRGRARTICPEQPCRNCGYDKHTEVCHRKAISDFDLSTPASVVNDKNNLIRLCPNCHWEFDNGLLDI